jgi:hypothetical protein
MAKWIDSNGVDRVGTVGWLVESFDNRHGGRARSALREEPLRTNQSLTPRLFGWCGETDNVSRHARGMAKVVRTTKAGDRALVVVLTGDELQKALEERGYPELAGEAVES